MATPKSDSGCVIKLQLDPMKLIRQFGLFYYIPDAYTAQSIYLKHFVNG